jgi:hypothetical protein
MSKLRQIPNLENSVVDIGLTIGISGTNYTVTISSSEWVGNKSITGLETDLWLEAILTNCTNHL